MRRSHLVVVGVVVLLVGYIAFVMARPGSLARRWLGHDLPETHAEEEPLLEGRPLHEWVAELSDKEPAFRRQAAEVLGEAGKTLTRHKRVGEQIANLLADPNPHVRYAAADALGKVYVWARAASNQLRDASSDDDANVRCAALSALAKLVRDDETALAALRGGLKDDSPLVREHTVNTLAEVGSQSPPAVSLLVEALKAPDMKMRRRAIAALAWIGPEAKSALLPMCDVLEDMDVNVRREAAAAMAGIAWKPQGAPIRVEWPVLSDKDSSDAAEPQTEISEETKAIVAALAAAFKDVDAGVRRNVLKALSCFASDAGDARASLLAALKDPDAEVRAEAVMILDDVAVPVEEVAPALLALLKDPDRYVRTRAAIRLSLIGPYAKAVMGPLLDALKDSEDKARSGAVGALCNICREPDQLNDEAYGDIVLAIIRAAPIKDEQSGTTFDASSRLQGTIHRRVAIAIALRLVEELKSAKADDKVKVAKGLYFALERIKHAGGKEGKSNTLVPDPANPRLRDAIQTVMPLLIDAVKSSNEDLRIQALEILTVIGPDAEAAIPALCEVLRSKDRDPSTYAVVALRELGPKAKAATPDLIELLKDPKFFFYRHIVAQTLGDIGPAAKDAVEPLRECLRDSDPIMRQTALLALNKIDPQAARRASVQ